MKNYLLYLFLFFGLSVNSQDLIQNGSFEQFSGCPNAFGTVQLDSVLFWINPAPYDPFPPLGGSPDYFNTCLLGGYLGAPNNFIGYQPSYDGSAYSGLILYSELSVESDYFREYIENPLNSTLEQDKCYQFEIRLNVANGSKFLTSDIQVYFSDTLISNLPSAETLTNYTPQLTISGLIEDTVNWISYGGQYIASGTENFILIGNFKNNTNTNFILINNDAVEDVAYVYVDKVSLFPCDQASLQENPNHSILIYPNPTLTSLKINGIENLGDIKNVSIQSLYGSTVKNITSSFEEIDISELHGGTYFLCIDSENRIDKLMFIKE